MKEVIIERLVHAWNMHAMTGVVLKEKDASRRLCIFVGAPEGHAIVRGLEPLQTPRPLTHDLMATLLGELRGTVRHVVITEMKEAEQTFYATIVLDAAGVTHEVDARPSDALALAVRAKAPIFVEEALFAWAEQQDTAKFGPLSPLWPFPQDQVSSSV
jgi:bifunctional DNase/RNase